MSKFIITLLFGWSGAHKFMEGKKAMGFIYLFTLGLYGIGWIYDTYKAYKDFRKQYNYKSNKKFVLPTSFQLVGINYECKKNNHIMRQDVLSNMNTTNPIYIEAYRYEGRNAYMIVDRSSGLDIGVIPDRMIDDLERIGIYKLKVSISRIYKFSDSTDRKGAEIEIMHI